MAITSSTQQLTSSDFDEAIKTYLPFLLEIRKRLFFVISIFLVFAVIGFIYYENIIKFFLKLLNLQGVNIVFTSPFQFFSLSINSGLMMGAIVISPFLILQILAFLKPALHSREYRTIIYLLPLSIALFLSGFGFGAIMMRYVVVIFLQKSVELQIGNYLDVSKLISQILTTATFMGIAFQFPIFLTLLMRFRIVKRSTIASKRLFAYIISLGFAALLPPTDLLSLALLTLPLIVLFELTLFLNKLFIREHIL